MRMGFDLDDVVFSTLPGLLEEGIRLGVIPDGVTPGDVSGLIDDQWGISSHDMKRILSLDFYDGLTAVEEVVDDIRRWISDGEVVFFITSRTDDYTPGVADVTRRCVDRYGLLSDSAGIIHQRSSKKWETARDLLLNSFVDDMPHVIRPMVGVVPRTYLLATDTNRKVDDLRRWTWSEVRDGIEEFRRSSRCLALVSD